MVGLKYALTKEISLFTKLVRSAQGTSLEKINGDLWNLNIEIATISLKDKT